jgi:hypothetical protein
MLFALLTDLEQVQETRPPSSWRTIERRLRKGLSDWRARLQGDIAEARAAFRELLPEPVRFTPFVERGYHAIRFEGRVGLAGFRNRVGHEYGVPKRICEKVESGFSGIAA